jgi:hypothetical protein
MQHTSWCHSLPECCSPSATSAPGSPHTPTCNRRSAFCRLHLDVVVAQPKECEGLSKMTKSSVHSMWASSTQQCNVRGKGSTAHRHTGQRNRHDAALSDVVVCHLVRGYRRCFGGTYSVHLQVRNILTSWRPLLRGQFRPGAEHYSSGHSIVSQHFMEPECSIPNSQELSTCSYP